MKIGIDVDLTLVDTGYEWWEWCVQELSKVKPFCIEIPSVTRMYDDWKESGKCSYNFNEEFPSFTETTGLDIFSFWKQDDLYDNIIPLPNSVEVVKQLVEAGHSIVFISHCHGGHFKSKVDWLKKYFPFADIGGKGGFIATKEKHLVNVDVMIDDRIENLLRFPDEVIKVYFNTIYADNEFVRSDVDMITSVDNGWLDIKEYFEGIGVL